MARKKRPTEADVNDAMRVLRQDYYSDIKEMAEEYMKEIENNEYDSPEDFRERLEQDIDGNQWVIYTHQAQVVMLVSENSDAFFDEGMGPLECEDSVDWSKLAYFAVLADVKEELDREGVDFDTIGEEAD